MASYRKRPLSLPRKLALRAFSSSTNSSNPNNSTLGIHVFRCPDVVGIMAKLSECIAQRGANLHSVDVFVPENKHVFYSRSEFAFDPAYWPRNVMDSDFANLSRFFNAEKSVVRVPDLDPKYKIAVLASKQEHCLVDLLHRWQEGRLPVDINCVISNHDRSPNTHVMRFLERHGIPYHYLPTTLRNKREEEILDLVEDTDFLVLARYMQVLSKGFLENYGKDIINIHHGLLPSFKGGNPSRQAYDAGVKLIGATTHFVTEELDAGPIIEQMSCLQCGASSGLYSKCNCIHSRLHHQNLWMRFKLSTSSNFFTTYYWFKIEECIQNFLQKYELIRVTCLRTCSLFTY